MPAIKKTHNPSEPAETISPDSKPNHDMVVRLNDIIEEADKDATGGDNKDGQPPITESVQADYGSDLETWRQEIIKDLRSDQKSAVPTKETIIAAPSIIKAELAKVFKTKKNKLPESLAEPPTPPKSLLTTPKVEPFKHDSPAIKAATTHIKTTTGVNKKINRHLTIKFAQLRPYLLLGLLLATSFYAAMIMLRLDKKIPKVAQILAVPVMTINDQVVTYGEFARNKLLIQRLNHQPDKRLDINLPATEQLAQELIVENYIMQKTAQVGKVTVSDANRDQLWQDLSAEFGTAEALTKFINYNLGLSVADYRQYVMDPYLLRLAILSRLNNDSVSQDQAWRQISHIKNLLKSGQINFYQAAATYSQDKSTAKTGGDLGWYTLGTLDPELESALTGLKSGQISEPIKTGYGYHLIKLLDVEKQTNGKIKNYHAAHILIKTVDFANWLEQQKARLTVFNILQF